MTVVLSYSLSFHFGMALQYCSQQTRNFSQISKVLEVGSILPVCLLLFGFFLAKASNTILLYFAEKNL